MKLNELLDSNSSLQRQNDRQSSLTGKDRTKDLDLILNVIQTINRSLVLDEVLKLVLDNAIRVAKGERGFLLLTNDAEKPECVVARDASGRTLNQDTIKISDTVVEDVYTTGESVCIENAQTDKRYDQRESIVDLKLETILCAPLIVRDEKIGVIYVDSRSIQPVNRDEIVDLFEILAGQAAIAIKNAKLYDSLQKAFQELQNTNEQLIKSERMASKGEMAAEVSHELQNLVQVVVLQLQSLSRSMHKSISDAKHPTHQKLDDSIHSVKRIGEFASGLLESSALRTEKKNGSLNNDISKIIRSIKTLSKYKNARFALSLDEKIPSFAYDAKQIQQIILNLIKNSVEASDRATITIDTAFNREENRVSVRISDNGPGIDKHILEKLFVSSITTKPEGNGYGLSVCKKIVENHGGTIRAESGENSGATFTLTLPTAM